MTEKQARDEGAAQTALIMAAVKRLRTSRGWSAQRLAAEMALAGVPWNADIIVNLEHGRRRSLRVHEFLALAFVLAAEQPLALLVPGDVPFPVVPGLTAPPADVRGWLSGERPPLRETFTLDDETPPVMEAAAQLLAEHGRHDDAALLRRVAALLTVTEAHGGQD